MSKENYEALLSELEEVVKEIESENNKKTECSINIGIHNGEFFLKTEGKPDGAAALIYYLVGGEADIKILESLESSDESCDKECLMHLVKYMTDIQPMIKASEIFKKA